MATSNRVATSVIDFLFPRIGTPRVVDVPIWDDGRSMFITNEYVKPENGNRYYTGVRQTERFMINIFVGKYKNWDYLDKVEVYVFDMNKPCLIGQREFNKEFYNEDLIDSTAYDIMMGYVKSEAALMNTTFCEDKVRGQIEDFVRESHFSILDESGISRLKEAIKILPKDCKRNN